MYVYMYVYVYIYIYVYYNCVYIYIGKPIYIYVIQYTHMWNVSKQRVYVYPPKSLWFPALEFSSAVSGKLARELGWDPAAARREPLWWRDQAPRQMKGPLLCETHGILICFRWMCFLVIYIYIYMYIFIFISIFIFIFSCHLYLHHPSSQKTAFADPAIKKLRMAWGLSPELKLVTWPNSLSLGIWFL